MRSFCRTFDLYEIIPNLRDASKQARLHFAAGDFCFKIRDSGARVVSPLHANSFMCAMLITRSSSHTSELKRFLDADERSNSSIAILRHASCVTSPSIPIFSDFLHFLVLLPLLLQSQGGYTGYIERSSEGNPISDFFLCPKHFCCSCDAIFPPYPSSFHCYGRRKEKKCIGDTSPPMPGQNSPTS